MNAPKLKSFENFWEIIKTKIHRHPVITNNSYCKWFKKGRLNEKQIIDLFEQFAVFSKWFLLAQLMRVLNAPDIESETNARYILVNELGVGIKPDGSTDEQPFKTRWAHINWLRETVKPLGLEPIKLGAWESASPATIEFIRCLEETYGSKEGDIGRGASYAIETWAAWGIGKDETEESNNFWKELISGIEGYNANNGLSEKDKIPLDFFLFHFNSEKKHGDNVLAELKQSFCRSGFDQNKFLTGGHEALEAIHTFWIGLDHSRKSIG